MNWFNNFRLSKNALTLTVKAFFVRAQTVFVQPFAIPSLTEQERPDAGTYKRDGVVIQCADTGKLLHTKDDEWFDAMGVKQ